LVTAVT